MKLERARRRGRGDRLFPEQGMVRLLLPRLALAKYPRSLFTTQSNISECTCHDDFAIRSRFPPTQYLIPNPDPSLGPNMAPFPSLELDPAK